MTGSSGAQAGGRVMSGPYRAYVTKVGWLLPWSAHIESRYGTRRLWPLCAGHWTKRAATRHGRRMLRLATEYDQYRAERVAKIRAAEDATREEIA